MTSGNCSISPARPPDPGDAGLAGGARRAVAGVKVKHYPGWGRTGRRSRRRIDVIEIKMADKYGALQTLLKQKGMLRGDGEVGAASGPRQALDLGNGVVLIF